jgi:hypothetical protein
MPHCIPNRSPLVVLYFLCLLYAVKKPKTYIPFTIRMISPLNVRVQLKTFHGKIFLRIEMIQVMDEGTYIVHSSLIQVVKIVAACTYKQYSTVQYLLYLPNALFLFSFLSEFSFCRKRYSRSVPNFAAGSGQSTYINNSGPYT